MGTATGSGGDRHKEWVHDKKNSDMADHGGIAVRGHRVTDTGRGGTGGVRTGNGGCPPNTLGGRKH